MKIDRFTGRTLFLSWVFSSALLCAQGASDAWPQWRGPLANGVAPTADPPIRWSETENVAWKVRLPGVGSGTPIVWGDQVFIQAAVATGRKVEAAVEAKPSAQLAVPQVAGQVQPQEGTGPRRRPPGGPGGGGRGEKPTEIQRFTLLALDRVSGKTLWEKTLREEVPHEGHHRDHGYASHSPVTDGERIYAWLGSRGLHCFDMAGDLKWQKDLGRLRTANGFGEGNSPALYGDVLVINWDHEGDDFIAAFDKKTGKELWRNPRDEKTTWTTPYIVEHGGKPQVVVSATGRIRSYDLATGRQIWECGGMTANVIPTPVSGFGMVYAISGFRGNSLLAIRLGREGDLTDSEAVAWRYGKSAPYVPSPVLYEDRLYFLSGNNATLSCHDAKSGEALFNDQRVEGPSGVYASLAAAAGRIYLVGRNGSCVVLKAGKTFEVLATNKLDDAFDASPALLEKSLFLRGREHLYCIGKP